MFSQEENIFGNDYSNMSLFCGYELGVWRKRGTLYPFGTVPSSDNRCKYICTGQNGYDGSGTTGSNPLGSTSYSSLTLYKTNKKYEKSN